MAYLINRNTSGLLPCLHGFTKYIVAAFGDTPFTIRDLKYNKDAKFNIHQFSPCAVQYRNTSKTTCRYLENPLSRAGCGLVGSVDYDPQKSKLASDIMNALDGLALVTRNGRQATITNLGRKFSEIDYQSPEWLGVAKRAVLSYGPLVGMLIESKRLQEDNVIRRNLLNPGFPNTDEEIEVRGRKVVLSTGSQADTVVRTRSVLISYAVNTGYMLPLEHPEPPSDQWHQGVYEYIMSKQWNDQSYKFYQERLPGQKIRVMRPLGYENLTKATRSLRERGQALVRAATIAADSKVKNRRLALAYLLSRASEESKSLNISKAIELMSKHDHFIVSKKNFHAAMVSELGIAPVIGIPYQIHDKEFLRPLTLVDIQCLTKNAPAEVLSSLADIASSRALYN